MADAPHRWVVVAAGGLMGCVAMGSLFAMPVLLTPMVEASGWSRTGISAAMTIAFLAMAVTSMIWGALSDRYGARPVVMAGAVFFAASLWLAARAETLLQFQLIFGLVAGGLTGHGDRSGDGRLDLRHDGRLWRDVYHLLRAGPVRVPGRHDLPAISARSGGDVIFEDILKINGISGNR